MKLILLGLFLLAFSSCSTNPNSYYYAPPNGGDMSTVSVGMTKAQVMQIKGRPDETRAQGGAEYLLYTNYGWANNNGTWGQNNEKYFVRLINGKVEAYGKLGDFGSTQQSPRTTIQVY
jgi:hypothetical protein